MHGFNCLVHFTSVKNLQNIQLQNALLTPFEKHQLKVKYNGVGNQNMEDGDDVGLEGEYPGIYFCALNDYDVGKVLDAFDYGEDVIYLVFSTSLLTRNDWHLNINDQNGYIDNFTFCRDTINDYPHDVSQWFTERTGMKYVGNELVFHNKVSMQCLLELWAPTREIAKDVESILDLNIAIKIRKKIPSMRPRLIEQFCPNHKTQNLRLCYGINTYSLYAIKRNPSTYLKGALLENCGIVLSDSELSKLSSEQLNNIIHEAFQKAPPATRLPPTFLKK